MRRTASRRHRRPVEEDRPAKAEAVKDLAYCLYDICANKRKDAKEATAYNALIAVWTELTRQAAAIHDTSGDRPDPAGYLRGNGTVAKSTRQYVFEGMELLPAALIPFVEKRLESSLKGHWQVQVLEKLPSLRPNSNGEVSWDQAALLNAMDRFWNDAFKAVLGRAERSSSTSLRDVRNKLSHNENFTYDDAERALDCMRRLMEAISAGETAEQLIADARHDPAHEVHRASAQ